MTPDIKTAVVGELCDRLQDMLLVALEEEPNNFVTLELPLLYLKPFMKEELNLISISSQLHS